jgi:zinc transport system permease protein
MIEIFTKLQMYFQYSMVIKALVVGVLIAFCSSLLGVTLVLKRYSFIGDGLSHVAFAALSIATIMNVSNNMLIVLPVTVIAAILMLRTGQNTRINGDAAVAMISVGSLAVGYMLMNIFSGSSNISGDVCSTLFGSTSILTLSSTDMWVCIIMSVIVLIFYLLFYHKIFSVTFDENFAKATGINSGAYNMLTAVISAVIIVLAMKLVGSLLISALIIFPALSAMRVYKNFMSVIICSGIISVAGAIFGILISLLSSTPIGATIVTVYIFVFLMFSAVGAIRER